jgi:hypothetical protein
MAGVGESNVAGFLWWVAQSYGESTRDECARILERRAVGEFSPLEILSQAQGTLYQPEIEAATRLGEIPFDSDFVDDIDG